jgi:biopolymer transport protein ExbD
MKRFSQRSGYHTMSELNVTPLLDLAFVLLIIFIITTPLMEQGIQLNLPTATATTTAPDPKSIKTVSVDRNGLVYLERNPISIARLETELRRIKAVDPEVAIIVRADKNILYQKVMDVVDTLQRAGVSKMALINTPEGGAR